MKSIVQSWLERGRKVLTYPKIRILLFILVILVLVMGGIILLLNFTVPRHSRRLAHKFHQKPPSVSYFKRSPTKSMTKVIDTPIQSTGCKTALSLSPGTTSNMGIKVNNIQRTYLVYLPPNYINNTPHAVVISFHGYASNDRVEERLSQFNTLAVARNFIVVYPQGTTGVLAARGWNTGLHPTLTADDTLFVSDMLNQLQANLCINPNQIYVTGFSNGGGFVGELACQLSNRIAAFAPISGSYVTAFSSCKATRPVPIIEFHGTADTIVPYGGLATVKEFATQVWLKEWAKKDGCLENPTITQESSRVTKYEWVNCNDNANIIHYKISGGRHVWPVVKFKQNIQGKVTYMNTANVIWNFFSQHPLLGINR